MRTKLRYTTRPSSTLHSSTPHNAPPSSFLCRVLPHLSPYDHQTPLLITCAVNIRHLPWALACGLADKSVRVQDNMLCCQLDSTFSCPRAAVKSSPPRSVWPNILTSTDAVVYAHPNGPSSRASGRRLWGRLRSVIGSSPRTYCIDWRSKEHQLSRPSPRPGTAHIIQHPPKSVFHNVPRQSINPDTRYRRRKPTPNAPLSIVLHRDPTLEQSWPS